MNRLETLRDARLRLNQIEHWLKNNPHRFSPTHLVVLRSVIEDTATPFHVRTIEQYMREWMLPARPLLANTEAAINSETGGIPA